MCRTQAWNLTLKHQVWSDAGTKFQWKTEQSELSALICTVTWTPERMNHRNRWKWAWCGQWPRLAGLHASSASVRLTWVQNCGWSKRNNGQDADEPSSGFAASPLRLKNTFFLSILPLRRAAAEAPDPFCFRLHFQTDPRTFRRTHTHSVWIPRKKTKKT